MIEAPVFQHYYQYHEGAPRERIRFRLLEMRTPEILATWAARCSAEASAFSGERPLLLFAQAGDLDVLRTALDAEMRAEQSRDRVYWEPLRKELEQLRHDRRRADRIDE